MKPIWIFLASFLFCTAVYAHPIDMKALAQIESSNNPKAYNKKTQARGLYQITPIVLKQVNERAKKLGLSVYSKEDLFNPVIAQHVASTYLNWLDERCDTVDEILIAWNWGIGHLRKWRNCPWEHGIESDTHSCGTRYALPKETREFLEKYHRLTDK